MKFSLFSLIILKKYIMRNIMRNIIDKLGASVLLALFIASGMNKIMNFDATVKLIGTKTGFNKLLSQLAIVGAIALLVFGSLFLLYTIFFETYKKNEYERKMSVFVVVLFLVFMVLATGLFHNFLKDPLEKINFMKNLSITGGFLLLLNIFL